MLLLFSSVWSVFYFVVSNLSFIISLLLSEFSFFRSQLLMTDQIIVSVIFVCSVNTEVTNSF